MSDGTVRGTFDLNADPALGKLRSIQTEGGRADDVMGQLGRTMDGIGGSTATRKLDSYSSRLRKVGDDAEQATVRVSTAWDAQRRSIEDNSTRIEARVDALQSRVERYGRTRASATVEVSGFEKANAQIVELERRLDRLSRQRSSPSVGLTGGFANDAGGVGGGGGGTASSAGGKSLGLGAKLAIGGAAVLPGVQALGVSSAALLGSAAGATLGAATVYGGALSTLATGAALTYSVAKPAVKELQKLAKEQTKYTEVVAKYGEASKQAATAREALNRAEARDPGADVAIRQIGLLRSDYTNMTKPGRRSFLRGVGNVAVAARHDVPVVARAANLDTGAVSSAATNFAGFLAGSQTQRTVTGLSQEFARDLPTAEMSVRNITSTFEHLALDARPFFREANEWVQTWTHGLASSTAGEAKVQTTMRGLVSETKDWGRLAGATFKTVRDIFNMGRPSGDSMVVELTQTLDRWDAWIQRNPAKVSTFFKEAQTTTEKIASALTGIVHLLSQMATTLGPIFNRGMELVSLVGRLGPGATTAASALAYGAFSGLRGGVAGGRSMSPGALVASGVLGRPVGLRGGSRAAGGVVVGGTRPAATATRYLMASGGGPTGAAARMGAAQIPLFIPRGSGVTTSRATPEAFDAEYGGIEGARYGMPVSELGETTGRLAGVRGAIGGAAKTLGATLAAVGALEAASKGGNFGQMAQNFGSSVSFGLIKGVNPQGGKGAEWASKFLQGIPSTMNAKVQQEVLARKITRDLQDPFFDSKSGVLGIGHQPVMYEGASSREISPSSPHFMQEVQTTLGRLEREGGAGGHGKNVIEEVKALRTAYQEAATRAKELKREQNSVLDAKSVEKATRISSQFGTGMRVEQHAGVSVADAFAGETSRTLGRLKELREPGAKILAENLDHWAQTMERGNPKLAGTVDALNKEIVAQFKSMGDRVEIINGRVLTGSQSQWEAIQVRLSSQAELAREHISKSFTAIQKEALAQLKLMGYSPQAAEAIVKGKEKGLSAEQAVGGLAAKGAAKIATGVQGALKRARGGIIGGSGLLDTQPVPGGMAAAGEAWIANRHTMADLSRATVEKYGLTAQQMISGESRLHSAQSRYATGGFVAAPGTNYTVGEEPMLARDLTRMGRALHIMLTGISGYRSPAHSVEVGGFANDPHTRGEASDTLGTQGIPASVLARFEIERPFSGAAEADHMQLLGSLKGGGARGGVGAVSTTTGAAQKIRLGAHKSGLGGVPGALADQGSLLFSSALQQHVNKHLAMSAGASSLAGFAGGGGTSSSNEALGQKMMIAAGYPASEWPFLKALWTQESGWNANSVNSTSGAYGIPQALGHGHPYALGDASAQIAWGLDYIGGRYGSPRAAEAHELSNKWYGRGGRATWAGWHAAGGEYETQGPVIFGAGENGKERVSITPAHMTNSTGSGHRIEINIAHVSMASGADVEEVAREVAGKIIDELDRVGAGPTDRELIGR